MIVDAVAIAAVPVMSLEVKAIVPVALGNVAVMLPLKAEWAGACNLA